MNSSSNTVSENQGVRTITLHDRKYVLTEAQLRNLLEKVGTKKGRAKWFDEARAFSSGMLSTVLLTLLTVPGDGYQNIGGITGANVRAFFIVAFFACSFLAIFCLAIKRSKVFESNMSTDDAISYLISNNDNPEKIINRNDQLGPQVEIKSEFIDRDIFESVEHTKSKISPKGDAGSANSVETDLKLNGLASDFSAKEKSIDQSTLNQIDNEIVSVLYEFNNRGMIGGNDAYILNIRKSGILDRLTSLGLIHGNGVFFALTELGARSVSSRK